MTTIATKYPFVGNVDTRQGGRDENQDNAGFVDTPLGLLLVVCDGMGGGPGGRTASHTAVDTILSILADVSPSTSRHQALQYAIEKANEAIYSQALETPELRGMGTTVAAVIVNEDSAVIAHVGDTRIYLLRKGTIAYRSNDHSFVANLVREKRITEEEARNHPRSNVITRALGIRPNVEAEIDEIPFLCGDRFILCTDGIWGAMPQKDLVQSLSRAMGLEEMTTQIVEEIDALGEAEGGGHDNMTIAVLDTTFDSAIKKVKKVEPTIAPPPVETAAPEVESAPAALPTEKHSGKALRIICVAGLLALLVAASVYMYRNAGDTKTDRTQEAVEAVKKIQQSEKRKSQAVNSNELPPAPHSSTGENLFSDQGVKKAREAEDAKVAEEAKKIEEARKDEEKKKAKVTKTNSVDGQIASIVEQLEDLKNLKSNNRSALQAAKKNYIQKNILPKLEDLQKLPQFKNKKKEKEFEDVRKMLQKDSKAWGASAEGKSTNESNKHIDKIIEKVKKLKE